MRGAIGEWFLSRRDLHDSSQARGAWNHEEIARPSGMFEPILAYDKKRSQTMLSMGASRSCQKPFIPSKSGRTSSDPNFSAGVLLFLASLQHQGSDTGVVIEFSLGRPRVAQCTFQ
jgi:hypothetical protein